MNGIAENMSKNPEIGVLGAVTGMLAPYLNFLTDFGQFVAVWFGVIVAGATAYIKIKEAIKIRRDKK